ncbi:unnamed protein product [Lymnaea stagnalis]|uniref:Uncharacterized protein n=1 Tax=Lymnaea stagnalis TaxID=6523 RepID=A0AAV2HC98_LYMST
MARTANTGARACLLTEDKGSLIKAIQTLGRYWQRRLVLSINIGGLSGFVFLLTRTTASMTSTAGTWHQYQHETVDDVVKNTSVDPQSNFIKDEFGCGDSVISPTTLRTDADGRDTDSSSEGSRVEPPNPFQYESSSGETVLPTTAVDSSDTLNLQRTDADGNTFCD